MMKKNLFLLTLCLIIITGRWAFADTCPNIVGDWDLTGRCIEYNPYDKSYAYTEVEGTFSITDQYECLFHGMLGSVEPITGAISNFIEVTMNNNGNNIINGILRGYDLRKKLFTRMDITNTGLPSDEKGFNTCRCTLKRK